MSWLFITAITPDSNISTPITAMIKPIKRVMIVRPPWPMTRIKRSHKMKQIYVTTHNVKNVASVNRILFISPETA